MANLTGIPFEKMMFLNLLYEFTTVKACTGIVLRNSEGKIIHGRNWDFGEYEYFGSMVSKVEYYKGGEKLFTEDTVAGSVFSITGIRHGAFAISLNARNPRGYSGTLLAVLMENNIPALWLVRKTFIEETNFADANKRLRETKISCPIYIIISGLKDNEGMVIERGTDHTHAYTNSVIICGFWCRPIMIGINLTPKKIRGEYLLNLNWLRGEVKILVSWF